MADTWLDWFNDSEVLRFSRDNREAAGDGEHIQTEGIATQQPHAKTWLEWTGAGGTCHRPSGSSADAGWHL